VAIISQSTIVAGAEDRMMGSALLASRTIGQRLDPLDLAIEGFDGRPSEFAGPNWKRRSNEQVECHTKCFSKHLPRAQVARIAETDPSSAAKSLFCFEYDSHAAHACVTDEKGRCGER